MFNKLSVVVVLAVLAAGCGVKAQTYVMTKDRVDQDQSGNAGCLAGKCAPQPEPEKKTRKVYVLEVSKPVAESQVKKIVQEETKAAAAEPQAEVAKDQPVETRSAPQQRAIVIPPIEDEPVAVEKPAAAQPASAKAVTGPKEAQSYTVLKDDTLQKIAKKFYGSYSQWIKIYDANKDKLKNPNFVRPGTVITIPAAE